MDKKQGGKKNRKLGRNADVCKRYRASDTEDKNRKRYMRRHLRRNPADLQAVNRFEQTYGKVADIGLTSRGKRLAKRYAKILQKAAPASAV